MYQDFPVAAFGRVEQSRLVESIAPLDKSPPLHQQLHRLKVASPRRVNQSRSSVTVFRVNLGATF